MKNTYFFRANQYSDLEKIEAGTLVEAVKKTRIFFWPQSKGCKVYVIDGTGHVRLEYRGESVEVLTQEEVREDGHSIA